MLLQSPNKSRPPIGQNFVRFSLFLLGKLFPFKQEEPLRKKTNVVAQKTTLLCFKNEPLFVVEK